MTDISEQLIANITKKYIFFFPSAIYSDVETSILAGMIAKDSYDVIAYNQDQLGAITHDIEQIALVDILNKNKVLQNNLLLLLDTKDKVSKNVFQFILDDYKQHMDCHVFITSWLVDNVKHTFPNLNISIFNAFKSQHLFFRNHYAQLEQYFNLNPLDAKPDRTAIFKNMKSTFSIPAFDKASSVVPVKPKPKTPKKRPKLQIDDDAIDHFLLKTVFNVDL